jgi:Fn3-like domain
MFSLNDSSATNHVRQFTVVNNADIPLTYQITHEPAGTALTFPKNSLYPFPGPVPLVDVHALVTISPMALSVAPGTNQTVQVTFSPPPSQAAADSTSFPVFSGYLKVVSTPLNESLTVSYLGLASELSSLNMLDNGNGATKTYNLPAVIIGSTGKIQRLPRTYTFQDDDVPVLEFRLVAGSRYTVVELVEAATQEATNGIPDSLLDGSADSDSSAANLANGVMMRDTIRMSSPSPDGSLPPVMLPSFASKGLLSRGTVSTTHDSVKPANVVGTVASSKFLPRNSMDAQYGVYALAWDGTVEGGGRVRNGDYQLRLRTLKLGFDAPKGNTGGSSSGIADSDSRNPWEVWTSPMITKA